MLCEYKRLQEYIKNKEPFYIYQHYSMYEYNNVSDLVYDKRHNDFFFVNSDERDKTWSPVNRSFHRIDGPAHVTPYRIHWHFNDVYYNFNEWIEIAPLTSQEKVKLSLKYAQSYRTS